MLASELHTVTSPSTKCPLLPFRQVEGTDGDVRKTVSVPFAGVAAAAAAALVIPLPVATRLGSTRR